MKSYTYYWIPNARWEHCYSWTDEHGKINKSTVTWPDREVADKLDLLKQKMPEGVTPIFKIRQINLGTHEKFEVALHGFVKESKLLVSLEPDVIKSFHESKLDESAEGETAALS